jgi:cold shock CspA family protein
MVAGRLLRLSNSPDTPSRAPTSCAAPDLSANNPLEKTSMPERERGVITIWFADRRFGFILRQEGRADLFFHENCVRKECRDEIAEGVMAEFNVMTDRGGKLKAGDVVVVPGGA